MLIVLALLTSAHAQIHAGGGGTGGGGLTINSAVAAPITGGQVSIPLTSVVKPQVTLFVRPSGLVYLSYDGATTDPNAGMWVANAAACEASPSTCFWTAVNHAGQTVVSGNYMTIREFAPNPPDSTHELMITGFRGTSGTCTTGAGFSCTIQVLDTTSNTYTTSTLPSFPTGQAPTCLARDSTGIYYTFTNYQGHVWHSPDSTGSGTWILITTDYTTLPGVVGAGNIYTCKVYGSRIYFGGEDGVISCDLAFSACSNDYVPSTNPNGQRNFSMQLADIEDGSASGPTLMIQCCRQDSSLTNYVPFALWSSGTWTGMTTASGIAQFGMSNPLETMNQTTGTGTARRYYFINTASGGNPNYAFVSTSSAATNFVTYSPALWPAVSTTYELLQLSTNHASSAKWALFTPFAGGTTPVSVYVTP